MCVNIVKGNQRLTTLIITELNSREGIFLGNTSVGQKRQK